MQSDEEFEAFALARTPALYRSAWLLCGDRHQAEDLVQETLEKIYARWHRPLFGKVDTPAAYAQTTLVRTFLSTRRKRANSELPFAELPDATTSDATASTDVRLELLAALTDLAPVDRAVVVMRYLEDLSVEETAARLGRSSGAVRNRSMRALAQLRAILDRSDDERAALATDSPSGGTENA